MNVLDKMRAATNRGTPCVDCQTTAVDCQIKYLETDAWCCPACRRHGALQSHRKETT